MNLFTRKNAKSFEDNDLINAKAYDQNGMTYVVLYFTKWHPKRIETFNSHWDNATAYNSKGSCPLNENPSCDSHFSIAPQLIISYDVS